MPLAVLAAVAALSNPAPAATFRVGTVEFRAAPPAGYCLPSGDAIAVDQALAATDNDNVSLLTLLKCPGTATDDPDYFMVKAPKNMLAASIERPVLLAELAKVMDLPEMTKSLDDGVANASKGFDRVFGKEVAFTGRLQPLGRDPVCAYLGGVLTIEHDGRKVLRAVSACLTSVGGKMIGVTRYSDGADPANVTRHLRTARALAEAITPVPAP